LGLIGADGGECKLASRDASAAELASGVFELTSPVRQIVFDDLAARPTLSFLRGFSAPVRIDDDLTESELAVLSRHDSDSFNRWQALQTLGMRLLLRGADALRKGDAPEAAPEFIQAYGALIAEALAGQIDPAFAAFALALPGEGDIAREKARDVDPDAIFAAREFWRAALGRAHGEALKKVHAFSVNPGPFSPDAASAGRRALRNGALAMLSAGDRQEGQSIALRQLAGATNMTERFGALAVIATIPGDAREQALTSFAQTYSGDPLILDKWLALQAHIPEAATLERVRALMRHSAFSLGNPNRVRALIGGFSANQTQFNRADGAGYELLGEIVLTLDPANPQVAARLLTALRSWRSLEAGRQARAKATLEKIAGQSNLSNDVRDIVGRSLA